MFSSLIFGENKVLFLYKRKEYLCLLQKVSSLAGLRTRSIFNRVQVRVEVHKKNASPSSSSLNFNFLSSSSQKNRVRVQNFWPG